MSDAVLARPLSQLRSILEVARSPTAERHLDRLPARDAHRAAGHRTALLGVSVGAGPWRERPRP